jgi:hypothetical protein
VKLPFGSAAYIGLGFAVFSMILILELFGSPFLRNVEVVVALLVSPPKRSGWGQGLAGLGRARQPHPTGAADRCAGASPVACLQQFCPGRRLAT